MTLRQTFILRDDSIRRRCIAFIEANAKSDVPLAVLVTEARSQRTLSQNAYERSIMHELAEKAWVDGKQFSHESWHEMMARMFGTVEDLTLPNGDVIQRRRSTTEMSVEDFKEFIEKIKAFAATTLGVELSL
jgi:hypothetical protein